MDNEKYYKNFNMVNELDIAGEFIYNGIDAICKLGYIGKNAGLFVALYDLSVGIERLQKIVLLLWKYNNYIDKKVFEADLKTHNHIWLNQEINKYTNKSKSIKFGVKENKFIELLHKFYQKARYERFNINGDICLEVELMHEYMGSFFDLSNDYFFTGEVFFTDEMKEFLGRVIGKISRKYYSLIKEGSYINNIYTYELRYGSKAEKIFGINHRNNSLISEKINERIAFKELILYFRKTNKNSAFLKFIDDINELDFDLALVNEYIEDISKGTIPQALVDEVEFLYGENNYSIDRMKLVDLIGETNASFDYPFIEKCKNILFEIEENQVISDASVEKLENNAKYIDDYELIESIDEILDVYNNYKNDELSLDSVINIIKEKQKLFIT